MSYWKWLILSVPGFFALNNVVYALYNLLDNKMPFEGWDRGVFFVYALLALLLGLVLAGAAKRIYRRNALRFW